MNENIKLKYGLWIAIIGLITVVISKIDFDDNKQEPPAQPPVIITNTNNNNNEINNDAGNKPKSQPSRAESNPTSPNPNRQQYEPAKNENSTSSSNTPQSPKIKNDEEQKGTPLETSKDAFSNLPQQWEGTYKDKSGTCPVVLQIEYHRADLVKGKFDWTSGRGKSITSFEGEIIERPTGFVEESKWKSLDNKIRTVFP